MQLMVDRHVYAAACDGVVVFLDLANDRYCALPGAQADALCAVLEGAGDLEQAALVQRALANASLCTSPHQKPLSLTLAAVGSQALSQTRERLTPWSTMQAAYARMRARALLARGDWAEFVQTRQARTRAGAVPIERIERASQAFEASGAYALKEGACLHRALALMLFLGPMAAHVDWVFGVRGLPFSAHCWVQCQDVLLNESVEQAKAYTPILVA